MPPRFTFVLLWWSAALMFGTAAATLLATGLDVIRPSGDRLGAALLGAVGYAYGGFLITPAYLLLLLGFTRWGPRFALERSKLRLLVGCIPLALPLMLLVLVATADWPLAAAAFAATWAGLWSPRVCLPWLQPRQRRLSNAPARRERARAA